MEVRVEGGDEFANASYSKICQNVFRDIGLHSNVDDVYMYCNPAEHVFIISVKVGRVPSPVTVNDMTIRGDKRLKVTNERYVPKLLALLWDKFGERVKQLSRLEISVDLSTEEMQELMKMVVYDPREDLNTRILDAVDRILPEGARVRYPIPAQSQGRLTIIASENPITDEWKRKAEEMVSKLKKELKPNEGGA